MIGRTHPALHPLPVLHPCQTLLSSRPRRRRTKPCPRRPPLSHRQGYPHWISGTSWPPPSAATATDTGRPYSALARPGYLARNSNTRLECASDQRMVGGCIRPSRWWFDGHHPFELYEDAIHPDSTSCIHGFSPSCANMTDTHTSSPSPTSFQCTYTTP